MDNIKDLKTADYTRRAVKKYESEKDKITIIAEKGTKDRIKNKYGDISISKYITGLIDADLNDAEKPTEPRPETAPKKAPKKSAPDQPTIKAENPADDPANDPALIFENFKS